MTTYVERASHDTDASRRGFVKGAAGLTFAFSLSGSLVGRPNRPLRDTWAKIEKRGGT